MAEETTVVAGGQETGESGVTTSAGSLSEGDWRSVLPPDLQQEKTLEKFKGVDGLAKSYVELEKDASRLRNAKGVIVPGENAKPEDIDAFHKAIGRPDTPEDYGFTKPDNLPEGVAWDADRMAAYAKVFHANGIPKAAAHAIIQAHTEFVIQEAAADEKAQKEFLEASTVAIKKEWGKDFEANLAQSEAIIEKLFGSEFKSLLKSTGLGNHPAVVRGMFKASQMIGEHALSTGDGSQGTKPTHTREGLISMKMDPRYHQPGKKDPAYIKEVEEYNRQLALIEDKWAAGA